jgi:hypothetical protein
MSDNVPYPRYLYFGQVITFKILEKENVTSRGNEHGCPPLISSSISPLEDRSTTIMEDAMSWFHSCGCASIQDDDHHQDTVLVVSYF